MISQLSARAGSEVQLMEATRILSRSTVEEPECLDYVFHQNSESLNEFVFYEQFLTPAGLKAHLDSPHTKTWFAAIVPLTKRKPRITPLKTMIALQPNRDVNL